jgi:hypothetical protein
MKSCGPVAARVINERVARQVSCSVRDSPGMSQRADWLEVVGGELFFMSLEEVFLLSEPRRNKAVGESLGELYC